MQRAFAKPLTTIFLILVSPALLFSDAVTGNAGFQSWLASGLDEDGHPYWDTTSLDGPFKSIGAQLVALPGTQLAGGPGAVDFWGGSYDSSGDAGGGADTDFFFNRNSGSSLAELRLEISAYSSLNGFGWYDVANPTVLHSIFPGAVSAGAVVAFTRSDQYGLYVSSGNGQTYYTQSSLNVIGETMHQHFALFRQSDVPGAEVYWVGLEDLSLSNLGPNEGGVGDYNDMIICLEAVPEPATLVLLASGLGMLALCRRFRRPAGRV